MINPSSSCSSIAISIEDPHPVGSIFMKLSSITFNKAYLLHFFFFLETNVDHPYLTSSLNSEEDLDL